MYGARVAAAKEAYAAGTRPFPASARRILLTAVPHRGVIQKGGAVGENSVGRDRLSGRLAAASGQT